MELQTQKAQCGPSDSIQSNGIICHRVVRSIAEMYRTLRSKKTGEVEKGRMSHVLEVRLECTKGRSGKVVLGMHEEQQSIRLISLAKGTV